jgi:hypothetical protein
VALGSAIAVAALAAWLGPDGGPTRYGTLRMLGRLTANRGIAAGVGLAAFGWAVLLAAGWVTGGATGSLPWLFR